MMKQYDMTKEMLDEEPRFVSRESALNIIIDEAYYSEEPFNHLRFDAAIDWLARDVGDCEPSIYKNTTRLVENVEGPDYNELLAFKRKVVENLILIKEGLERNVLELDYLKQLFQMAEVQEELVRKFMMMGA